MKTRRIHLLLWAIFFVLVEFSGYSCGPDWPDAVFVKQNGPDAPYSAFAGGRLGVPQSGYRTRHLVVIYRYLTGLPLSAAEQGAAIKANDHFVSSWGTVQQDPTAGHKGFLAWIAARKDFGPIDGYMPPNPFGTGSVWQYDSYYENCLDDAFANAAHTLAARASSYGKGSADVVEWVRGQDAVFQSCGKPQAGPAALPASAPEWLQDDRAYQSAAALLYQGKDDAAISAFSAIAANRRSAWSVVSHYLVCRVMVRRAVSLEGYYPGLGANAKAGPSPKERLATYLGELRAARGELETIRSEPGMRPLAHAIDAMIDRVNARLEPDIQARRLAMRLTAPSDDPNYYQDVLDLSYLLSGDSDVDPALADRPATAVPPPANERERRADDLLAWIKALGKADETSSVQHWKSLRSEPWLLAALMLAKPGDAAAPALVEAAAQISPSDPAYSAVMYQRLRLLPDGAAARSGLLAVLPRVSENESASTRNLFAELNARSAPDFETWLRQAARRPAAEAMFSEEEAFDNTLKPQPCGPPLRDADTPLFAADAATVLNTRLPLRLLAQAAEGTSLPPNLRFQVAQAAWTRAVLLDRRDIALGLAPVLIGCNAKWEPVLSDYKSATSAKDRKAAALFALMRFASTEPNVREGNYRSDGFASYSIFRDNWWCFTVPPMQRKSGSWREQYGDDISGFFTSFAHPDVPDPVFLTPEDRAEAVKEIAVLRAIPKASVYLPSEALAWQRAHPDDPRAPELLGQAFRVVRNAGGDKTSSEMEHRLFVVLHRQYPKNHWTLRYRSWE